MAIGNTERISAAVLEDAMALMALPALDRCCDSLSCVRCPWFTVVAQTRLAMTENAKLDLVVLWC